MGGETGATVDAESTSPDARTVASRRLSHVPALDGLRGVAVLLVLFTHVWEVTPRLTPRPFYGFLGVDIFFVLSGFLITALLLREQASGAVSFRGFYRRRALRLLPALFALVAAYSVYAAVTDLGTRVWPTMLSMVFYFDNWRIVFGGIKATTPPGLGHMWSLSIEEQFYMLWPAILIIGLKRQLSIVVAIIAAVILVIHLDRAVFWSHGTNWVYLYVRTDARADSLLIGALVALLWVRGYLPTRYTAIAAIPAMAFFAWCLHFQPTSEFFPRGGYTLVALAVAVVLLAVLDGGWLAAVFSFAPLRAVGRVSYGLYLWHFPAFLAVRRYGSHLSSTPRLTLALVLAAGLTVASWFAIERPFLRLKYRASDLPTA